MAKKCNKQGCQNPIWGGGFCRYHGYLRTDKKPKGLKKEYKPTGEYEVFKMIWGERPHKSEISGRDLEAFFGTDFWVNCFAHILNKGLYGKFRLLKENICLCHPDEHQLIDSSTKEHRQEYEREFNCSFDIFYERREQLKKKYNEQHNA